MRYQHSSSEFVIPAEIDILTASPVPFLSIHSVLITLPGEGKGMDSQQVKVSNKRPQRTAGEACPIRPGQAA